MSLTCGGVHVVMVVVVVLLVARVEVVPLAWLTSTRVHAGLGSSSIPATVIPRYIFSDNNNASTSPVIVRRVRLVVLAVGRVAVLLSILTTTGTRRELLAKLVSGLARVTEASILDTVLLSRARNMTRAQWIAGLHSGLWSGLWSGLRSGLWS